MRDNVRLLEQARCRSVGDTGIVVERTMYPVPAPQDETHREGEALDETVTRSINIARGRVARREQLTANALTIVCATADLVDEMNDPGLTGRQTHHLAVEVRTQLGVLKAVLREIDGVA